MTQAAPATKRWNLQPVLPRDVRMRLSTYHPVLAQVLYNRGQDTPEKARQFLDGGAGSLHNPFSMHDMPEAVARIRYAIRQGQKIAVYGDFDADGVTSTALLTQALVALGGDVKPYIPHRVDEGYGLNTDALDRLLAEHVALVITVDCGIRSVAEVQYAKDIGLDIIVTDHHSVGEEIPPADAVLNPKIDARLRLTEGRKNGYPEDMLAGVGVAYKLAEALLLAEEKQGRRRVGLRAEDLLDLVALGTVADLAPLNRVENRELVRRGLEVLNLARRPGLYELLQVAGVEPGKITTTSIGYLLGPRINAAGRIDNAMVAYDLLTSEMPLAGQLAQRLQELNLQRQIMTTQAVEIARARALSDGTSDLPLIFDAGDEYTSGIVGLVAGRLCEEFYRPAVVVERGEEEARGSCRSIPEFDVTAALDRCADLLVRHGGHAQAAGFTVRLENLPLLRDHLVEQARHALQGRELIPALDVDAEVPFLDLTLSLAQELSRLEPCGASNSAPVLCTRGLRVDDYRQVGADGKHLRLVLSNGSGSLTAIAFKQGHWYDALSRGTYVDVAHHLELNTWNGETRLQLNVQDLRLSAP
ncbi:single-stranded-DNA-specific exonuclease RecJ [Aggregatilinea lenta]|uniref:single-stranded-DNA-specific exonuclease RecJ n=1 Tax=Aggregatilinea lenta TaxID=913108 RepID=UPI0013C306E7|nr:single-stranded-DNA-specific exonuclease RecJ [Aggregatilinea lenta]